MPEDDSKDGSQVQPARPGTVISPGSNPEQPRETTVAIQHDSPSPEPTPLPQPPTEPAPAPLVEPQPIPPEPVTPQVQSLPPETETGGFFNPAADEDGGLAAPVTGQNTPQAVSWTASEFIAHNKSAGWYLGLAVAAAILAFFVYVITKDFISVGVVIMAAAIFGIYGAHKPRQLDYQVDRQGLAIGGKRYSYDEFKSFSVVPEGNLTSIVFMPLKRFAPPLSIYYPPEEQDKITAVLANSLPYEEPRRDAVDSLMKKVRF